MANRTLDEIWERTELVEGKTLAERQRMKEIKRVLRSVTRTDSAGNAIGNPFTVLKFREPAISRLVKSGRLGGEEMRAIDEIERVYTQLCSVTLLRGYEIRERGDRGQRHEPLWFNEAYNRYTGWAQKWSDRKKQWNDPSLEIVFDILFSDRSGKDIDAERSWKHGFATTLFVNSVRDYTAMAGWVDRDTASKWSQAALSSYPVRRVRGRTA